MEDKTAVSDSTLKRRSQFRTAGLLVLLLGIVSACGLYWIRTRAQGLTDDPMMAGYSRPETRQMAILYGKMGLVTSDFFDALKRPGTQAILIMAISVLIAFVCFYLARRWVDGDETS